MLSGLASFAVRARWWVVVGWVVVLAALGGAVGVAGTAFSDASSAPHSDSSAAYELMSQAGAGGSSGQSGTIVWHTSSQATDAGVQTRVAPVLAQISRMPGVSSISSPFAAAGASPADRAKAALQVSKDGHTAYATVNFGSNESTGKASSLARAASTDGLNVQTGGVAFTNRVPGEGPEIVGVLAALVVLLLVFRSVPAALVPIISGVFGVGVGTVLLLLLSHVVSVPEISLSLGGLVGLGVGIDYALFIVNRTRQALRHGAGVGEAVRTAMNTSGRAVVFAAITVVIALLGMLVLRVGFLSGIAEAAALTVAMTMIVSITLLPALLALLGRRILPRKERDPGFVASTTSHGIWDRWQGFVHTHRVVSAVAGLVVLVVLALPAASLRLGSADASSDPKGTVTRSFADTMAQGFGAGHDATLVVVARTPDASAGRAWSTMTTKLAALPHVASVTPSTTLGKNISMVSITPTGAAQDATTEDLVNTLRHDVIPSAQQGTTLEAHVGGSTATNLDFAHAVTSKLPTYLVLVAVLGFLLVLLAFRSVAVALLGTVGNLVSICIALAACVALFQWGWGPARWGVGGTAPTEYMVAMLIVGVMFGLSMDYHVFLSSQVQEEVDRGDDHDTAVRHGAASAGAVITTAALIMACVFASFGFTGMRSSAEFGVPLAVAVLADALVFRMTVVPALLHLLGSRAWWVPGWLDRVMPHVSVEGSPNNPTAGSPRHAKVEV